MKKYKLTKEEIATLDLFSNAIRENFREERASYRLERSLKRKGYESFTLNTVYSDYSKNLSTAYMVKSSEGDIAYKLVVDTFDYCGCEKISTNILYLSTKEELTKHFSRRTGQSPFEHTDDECIKDGILAKWNKIRWLYSIFAKQKEVG